MTWDNPETVLAAVIEQVRSRTGLAFGGCHQQRMRDVVAAALLESGAGTSESYVQLLDSDPKAYEALIDRLTIGETYFFRDAPHFDLVRDIAAAHTGAKPLRVWSAGCASGEEPYSLAIGLHRAGLLHRAEIVGSDVSARAIERARAAVYGDWSLRRCDQAEREAYFIAEGGRFRLREPYARAVRFRIANVVTGPTPAPVFDVVLCRNVLIYLSDDSVLAAAHMLRNSLAPGGWLLLGSSDPPLDVEGLEPARTTHGVVYRRLEHRDVSLRRVSAARPARRSACPPANPRIGRVSAAAAFERVDPNLRLLGAALRGHADPTARARRSFVRALQLLHAMPADDQGPVTPGHAAPPSTAAAAGG